jgi:outer membrane protein
MEKRVIFSIVCCFVMLLILSAVSFAQDKVGYINLQRLVNESTMGKAARAEIEKLRNEKETLLKNKLKEINDIRELINKEGDKMDVATRQKRIKALNKANKEYQRLAEDAKEDLTNEDNELVAIILQKADGVLKSVAKSKKYAIILKDANAIGYLDPSVDITDDVLKELNK